MKHIIILISILALFKCSSSENVISYEAWNADDDKSLNRTEFVNGYMQSGYFERWSDDQKDISYDKLYGAIFNALDTDEDDKISLVEFNSKIRYYYFGMFNGSFATWDNDIDASLNKEEFMKNITESRLGNYWDTTNDEEISERELAGAMFYLCDTDSDGEIERPEFDAWKRNRKHNADTYN